MIRLSYVSDATRPVTQRDLDEILAGARDFNQRHGLTGLLVYADGSFLQVVEGQESDVALVMARVHASTRHANIRESAPVQQAERRFPDWAMGFENSVNQDVVEMLVMPLVTAGAITRQDAEAVLMARFTARTGLSADNPLVTGHAV